MKKYSLTDAVEVTIAASKMLSGCAGRARETATLIMTAARGWSVETTTVTPSRYSRNGEMYQLPDVS